MGGKTARPARKRSRRPTGGWRLPATKLLLFAALFVLLMVSVGVAGYVIFFRVVVAGGAPTHTAAPIAVATSGPPDTLASALKPPASREVE